MKKSKKIIVSALIVLSIAVFMPSLAEATTYFGATDGPHYVPEIGAWALKVDYMTILLFPSTGRVEGHLKFDIDAGRARRVLVADYQLWGDSNLVTPKGREEAGPVYLIPNGQVYDITLTPAVALEWENPNEDNRLGAWADIYSISFWFYLEYTGFSVNAKIIYYQVVFYKVGSVYWGFDSGICVRGASLGPPPHVLVYGP